MRNNPNSSVREIANTLNTNKDTVWRTLRKNNYKPYKFHLTQNLHQGDAERRLRFCRWLRAKMDDDANILNHIIWSDESNFTNCGIFNRHNEHHWSIENPRQTRQVRPQIRFSLNVWCGVLGNRILGPYIYEGTLNSERYLVFLNTEFNEYLEELPLQILRDVWFQQDGAPPHNSRIVRNHLHRQFPEKWIGNNGFVEWPARSPDLSVLDFFLWGTLKNYVYKRPANNIDALRNHVLEAFQNLRQRDIQRAVNSIQKRINLCIQENGGVFEHLI